MLTIDVHIYINLVMIQINQLTIGGKMNQQEKHIVYQRIKKHGDNLKSIFINIQFLFYY